MNIYNLVYIDEQLESYELTIEVTKVIGYSLVIVIGVIGFMNLINSMITSIITRKKELGMLQAIGLTDKQLVKMLNIEAMFYTGHYVNRLINIRKWIRIYSSSSM